MKHLSMRVSASAVLAEKIDSYQQHLLPEIERLQAARATRYDSRYASVYLPFDDQLLERVQQVVREKRQYTPRALIVIGIGGSSLGTKAVHEALAGVYYNEAPVQMKLYFVETIDADVLAEVLARAEAVLQAGEHILVNVISKSGTTTETIANYELFMQLLKKYHPDIWHHFIVITTDEGSLLWQLASERQITRLAIPARVGGRYSVFSAVGLFPLALLGVDIQALLSGAQQAIVSGTESSLVDNPAALSAAIIVEQYRKGLPIHDMFLFSVALEGIGKWYRQLVGESLGKESQSGTQEGIVPTVSVGTVDLHSVGQLYLGGPLVMSTTFVTVAQTQATCVIPEYAEFEPLVAHIQGRTMNFLMNAVVAGVLKSYDEKKLPYILIQLPEKNPYYIGNFLQWKMIEIMYIGFLLQVNPFDQPHVERYKAETRKILAHE